MAFDQSRQPYSSGDGAGLARNENLAITGFPFHPPDDKQEGTIHVLVHILHARSAIAILSITQTHQLTLPSA
jgi:hypothetical protein